MHKNEIQHIYNHLSVTKQRSHCWLPYKHFEKKEKNVKSNCYRRLLNLRSNLS